MGRIGKTISKNIKVMARTKSSAVLVFLGPLLVVLLVGLAFNTQSLYELNVGITGGVNTEIRQDLINSLENKSYLVLEVDTQEECIEKIKQGAIHTCIVIPDDFSIEGNNEIKFYVDNSRPNLVWKVIGAISEETSIRAEELSYQLSSDLLRVINDIKGEAETGIAKILLAKNKIDEAINKLNNAKESASSISIGEATIDLSQAISDIEGINTSAKTMVNGVSSKVEDILEDSNASSSHDTARSINTTVSNYYEDLESDINGLISDLNQLESQVEEINQNIEEAEQKAGEVSNKIGEVIAQLEDLKEDLDEIKAIYESMIEEIDNIKIKSAEKIAQPIETRIETVATKDSQILYMSPYLLMLLVMLVGLMLSGTIVVVEKNSKAMFRNYTVPTSKAKFLIAYYVTSLILVMVEVIVIGGIAYLFINGALFSNIDKIIVLLLLSATLFILLGIVLGYLADAQEGLTIGSLSLGIILLFLSNLVLPLESMTPIIRKIANYNPYVIASETARRIMLFNAGWRDIYTQLLLLLGYIGIGIILIIIAEKLSFKNLLMKSYKKQLLLAVRGIVVKDKTITNKEELRDLLKNMNDEEWEKISKNKELKEFVKKVLKDKEMLKYLRNRKELLKHLDQEKSNKKKA